jgi:CheY-like chemotaxis protein
VATDINGVVRGIAPLLKRTLGERIEVATDLKDDLWQAMVDRGHLETALVNLAVNARDAIGEGGIIRIATNNVRLGRSDVRAGSEAAPGAYVVVAVSDTGTGMTSDVRDRIFEPFFTTKRFGRGSGLGLSMVYGFIRQSGGHITVESEVGVGTTITLHLPRAIGDGGARREIARALSMRAAGDEVILVVEDDERVRRTVVNTLRRQGYGVIEASGAADALRLVDEAPRIDLVFIDVALHEGSDGREVAKTVRDRRPATRVVLTSGYAQAAADADGRLDGFRLLPKPYRRGDLADTVRQELGLPAG